jgi:hypothetical protein
MLYRNVGGPWRRSTGEVVDYHGTFEPTETELARMRLRKQLGIRFVPVTVTEARGGEVGVLVSGGEAEGAVATVTAPEDSAEGAESAEEMQQEQAEQAEQPAEEPAEPATAPAEEPAEEPAAVVTTPPPRPKKLDPWPLKMVPEKYLQLHPEGQHAELARQYVARETSRAADH